MTEIVINASGVSPDVLVWLKRGNNGHYYIERRPNREHTKSNFFKASKSLASEWAQLPVEDAWIAMERYVGAAPI